MAKKSLLESTGMFGSLVIAAMICMGIARCDDYESFPSYTGTYTLEGDINYHGDADNSAFRTKFILSAPKSIALMMHPFNRTNGHIGVFATIFSLDTSLSGIFFDHTGDFNPSNRIIIPVTESSWADSKSYWNPDLGGYVCTWDSKEYIQISLSPRHDSITKRYPTTIEQDGYALSPEWTEIPVNTDGWSTDDNVIIVLLVVEQKLRDNRFIELCYDQSSYRLNATASMKYKLSRPFNIGDPRIRDNPETTDAIKRARDAADGKNMLWNTFNVPSLPAELGNAIRYVLDNKPQK
ncbi:MAG: hypothetical protein A2583_00845 [Bdellovibrionales bacterium RIFOXYD1_FULL_53_11]|nr:MAG: hypothetical protein A2583_00845 [Bdellovibrionales bacterium RIFOXYD1_FULL_53_11]